MKIVSQMNKTILATILALIIIAPAVFGIGIGTTNEIKISPGDEKVVTIYLTNVDHENKDVILEITGPLAEFITYEKNIKITSLDEIKPVYLKINYTEAVNSNERTKISLHENQASSGMMSATTFAISGLPVKTENVPIKKEEVKVEKPKEVLVKEISSENKKDETAMLEKTNETASSQKQTKSKAGISILDLATWASIAMIAIFILTNAGLLISNRIKKNKEKELINQYISYKTENQ